MRHDSVFADGDDEFSQISSSTEVFERAVSGYCMSSLSCNITRLAIPLRKRQKGPLFQNIGDISSSISQSYKNN